LNNLGFLKDRRKFFRFLWSEIPFFEGNEKKMNEEKYIIDNYGRIIETVRVLNRHLKPNGRLLDLGIYPGHIALILGKKIGIRVFGVALTTSKVFENKMKRNQINIIKSDLDRQEIPFDDGTFQVVLCSEVIEHLDSPSHLLREAFRVLVDDGILILTTPNIARIRNRKSFFFHGISPNICPPGEYNPFSCHEWVHFREYTLEEIKKLLTGNSFQLVESKYLINQHFDENRLRTMVKGLMPRSLRRGIIVVAHKAH
jgi:2-polyprenyl-3-methyl-5-hydroxy-6-metoxy-1,4-benzoquinol methylase